MMANYIETAPRIAVLTASGINRAPASQAGLELAGARADIVHIGALVSGDVDLFQYQGLMIPGGFPYGDDIQSGVVFARDLLKVRDDIDEFVRRERPIVAICAGFQTVIQAGLLPFGEMTTRDGIAASLTTNKSGKFESRWVTLKPEESVCRYVLAGDSITLPVDHGEGRFVASEAVFRRLQEAGQIVWRYSDGVGEATEQYPENPNGSRDGIAAITDPTGVVFGGMPHWEDFVRVEHHPNWRRQEVHGEPDGLRFAKQFVLYAADVAGA